MKKITKGLLLFFLLSLTGSFSLLRGADTVAPWAVSDLTALPSDFSNALALSWTAPGDSNGIGDLIAGSSFTMQYTTSPTFTSWSPTAGQPAFVFRTIIATSGVSPTDYVGGLITGLSAGSTYFSRLWTSDKVGNFATISNAATAYVKVPSFGVSISSLTVEGLNFTTVTVNTSSFTGVPIQVQNIGNVVSKFQLSATDSQHWTLSASTGTDNFVLMALFSSTASATPPDTSEFTDGQDEVLSSLQSSTGTTTAGRYNASVNMEEIMPPNVGGSARYLWFRLRMPSESTSALQQQFRIYVTAVQN